MYVYYVSALALQQKPKKLVRYVLDSTQPVPWTVGLCMHCSKIFPCFFFWGASVTGLTCFVRKCNLLENLKLFFICPLVVKPLQTCLVLYFHQQDCTIQILPA